MNVLVEPRIHSHILDVLPETHPLAHEQVACRLCGCLVHAFNNECMQTWVECDNGPFCLPCFNTVSFGGVLRRGLTIETEND